MTSGGDYKTTLTFNVHWITRVYKKCGGLSGKGIRIVYFICTF